MAAEGLAFGAALVAGIGLDVGLVAAVDAASGAWLVEVRRRKKPMTRLLVFLSLWRRSIPAREMSLRPGN
jgi:hypothetical protein